MVEVLDETLTMTIARAITRMKMPDITTTERTHWPAHNRPEVPELAISSSFLTLELIGQCSLKPLDHALLKIWLLELIWMHQGKEESAGTGAIL